MDKQKRVTLPDNAFRELKEGEQYTPLMPKETHPREVTAWSVGWGILMAIQIGRASCRERV